MKKIVLTVLGMMFITSSAFAASMGISGTALYYNASGTETTKSSAQTNEGDENGVAPIPSFFIEKDSENGIVGVEIIPYGAKVADFDNARTDTDTDDASDTAGNNKGDVNFKNHITFYMEKPVDGPIDGSFIKYGISTVSIETEETNATGSTYGDERVFGVMLGFGKKTERANGTFFKVVGEIARYQGASFDGSNDSDSVKNTIELDAFTTAGIRFSVGRSF